MRLKHFLHGMAISAISVYGLASCSDDVAPNQPVRSGEVSVTVSTTLPMGLKTYAMSSAEGGLKNLEKSTNDHSVRYILEVYAKGGTTPLQRFIEYKELKPAISYTDASFDIRLTAAEYDFVFYADIVRPASTEIEGLTGQCYYNSYFYSSDEKIEDSESYSLLRPTNDGTTVEGNLQMICATASDDADMLPDSSEMYDVFTFHQEIDLRTAPTTQSITLKRPFAKLRVVTTDGSYFADLGLENIDPNATQIKLDIPSPTAYNALSGESLAGDVDGYWKEAKSAAAEEYEDETEGDMTLYVFYLPVDNNQTSQNLTLSITAKDKEGNALVSDVPVTVENVPLAANKLTTIKGHLITKNSVMTITLDDTLDDPEQIVTYPKEETEGY